jgi:hypothetical protein
MSKTTCRHSWISRDIIALMAPRFEMANRVWQKSEATSSYIRHDFGKLLASQLPRRSLPGKPDARSALTRLLALRAITFIFTPQLSVETPRLRPSVHPLSFSLYAVTWTAPRLPFLS